MLDLSSKKTDTLLPTDILFQTPYWAQVKSSQGLEPLAFDIVSAGPWGDVLVLLKPCGKRKIAVVPQGPEHAPREEDYGIFLEDFSLVLAKNLSAEVAFIRYDLPWKSPYADEMQEQGWSAFPEPRLRELRMNMGTRFWNIRKSFEYMTVASSLVVDIAGSESGILERMKPKTRYNIGLAQRKGVTIHEVNADSLHDFHTRYCQTARRNGFKPCGYTHFAAMFQCLASSPDRSELLFLLARHGRDILAGAIVGISGKAANFLYGASSNTKRNFMAPSLMHWTAMLHARERGCVTYEMGAVSPGLDNTSPFHGLYRFKTGFGGRIELRSGSWDYPIDHEAYRTFCNTESLYRETHFSETRKES
ncbi:MAG: peptidoglycan bridge formation glycyltransferase FemA/FemB family protein [Clostridia bacterium]|nr:peptidoglycan bridge formation glycyltransferase FemA/FemB family protein [Clostridia bacterium]